MAYAAQDRGYSGVDENAYASADLESGENDQLIAKPHKSSSGSSSSGAGHVRGADDLPDGADVTDDGPRHPSRNCILYSFALCMACLTTMFFTLGFVYEKPLLGALFLASIVPSFLILWLAYGRSDPYKVVQRSYNDDKVPPELLVVSFAGGVASTIVVGFVGMGLQELSRELLGGGKLSFVEVLLFTISEVILQIALVEETAKYVIARMSIGTFREYVVHPYGVVLFGLAAALGFAGIENTSYVMSESSIEGGWYVALVRAVLSVPLHGTTGTLIGIGLARRAFLGDKSFRNVLQVLALPVLVHGTYDLVFMLPFRNGPFDPEHAGHHLHTNENTIDIGNYMSLLYFVNVLVLAAAITVAYRRLIRLEDEYTQRSRGTYASMRRDAYDDDDVRKPHHGNTAGDDDDLERECCCCC